MNDENNNFVEDENKREISQPSSQGSIREEDEASARMDEISIITTGDADLRRYSFQGTQQVESKG